VNSARFCPLCQCADLHGLSKIHLKHFWSLFRPPFFGNSSFFLFFFPLTLRTHTFSSSYGTYQPNSCKMGFCPIDILAKPRPPTTFPLSHRSPFSAVAILVQKKLFFTFPTARPEPAQSSPRQRPPNIGPLPPFQDTKEARSHLPYCRGPRPRATESGRHDVLPPQMIIFSSFLNPVFASAHRMIIFQKKSFLRSTFTPPPPPPTPPPHPPFLF